MSRVLVITTGGRMAALTWGSATSPLRILCIHGWLDNAASFDVLGPRLASELPAHVIAVDMPGHGKSSHLPEGVPYTSFAFALGVVRFLKVVGWMKPFVLVGHSLGAGISLLIASAFPELVLANVYLDQLGLYSQFTHGGLRRFFEANVEKPDSTVKVSPTLEDAVAKRVAAHNSMHSDILSCDDSRMFISSQAAEALVKRSTVQLPDDDPRGPGIVFTHDKRVMWAMPMVSEDIVRSLVQTITAPTLILLADDGACHSPWTPGCAIFLERAVLLPGEHEVVWLPGSHHLHADVDTAGAVGDKIIHFLRKHVTTVTKDVVVHGSGCGGLKSSL